MGGHYCLGISMALEREFKNTLRENSPGHRQEYLPDGSDNQSVAWYPATKRI